MMLSKSIISLRYNSLTFGHLLVFALIVGSDSSESRSNQSTTSIRIASSEPTLNSELKLASIADVVVSKDIEAGGKTSTTMIDNEKIPIQDELTEISGVTRGKGSREAAAVGLTKTSPGLHSWWWPAGSEIHSIRRRDGDARAISQDGNSANIIPEQMLTGQRTTTTTTLASSEAGQSESESETESIPADDSGADKNVSQSEQEVTELDAFQAASLGYFRHSFSTSVIIAIAYSVVFIIGIIGNSFVVAIVCKSPRMRTVTNYFIANLALADILVLLFCLPATFVGNLFIPYVLGLFVCKTVSYLQGVAVSASINTMVAVTLDRFLAICFPMDWHMSRRTARWTIACIWLFSMSVSLPWAIYFTLLPYKLNDNQTIQVCSELWPSERMGNLYFVCANLILLYLFPACVIILCYLGIWYKIERRNIPGDRPKGLKIELIMQKSKLKVIKMMMVVVVIFLLSWLPLYLIFARIKLAEERSQWEDWLITTFMPLAQWLGASNSCINPILYTFFNRKYKRGFIDLLKLSFRCCGPSCFKTTGHQLQQPDDTRQQQHLQLQQRDGLCNGVQFDTTTPRTNRIRSSLFHDQRRGNHFDSTYLNCREKERGAMRMEFILPLSSGRRSNQQTMSSSGSGNMKSGHRRLGATVSAAADLVATGSRVGQRVTALGQAASGNCQQPLDDSVTGTTASAGSELHEMDIIMTKSNNLQPGTASSGPKDPMRFRGRRFSSSGVLTSMSTAGCIGRACGDLSVRLIETSARILMPINRNKSSNPKNVSSLLTRKKNTDLTAAAEVARRLHKSSLELNDSGESRGVVVASLAGCSNKATKGKLRFVVSGKKERATRKYLNGSISQQTVVDANKHDIGLGKISKKGKESGADIVVEGSCLKKDSKKRKKWKSGIQIGRESNQTGRGQTANEKKSPEGRRNLLSRVSSNINNTDNNNNNNNSSKSRGSRSTKSAWSSTVKETTESTDITGLSSTCSNTNGLISGSNGLAADGCASGGGGGGGGGNLTSCSVSDTPAPIVTPARAYNQLTDWIVSLDHLSCNKDRNSNVQSMSNELHDDTGSGITRLYTRGITTLSASGETRHRPNISTTDDGIAIAESRVSESLSLMDEDYENDDDDDVTGNRIIGQNSSYESGSEVSSSSNSNSKPNESNAPSNNNNNNNSLEGVMNEKDGNMLLFDDCNRVSAGNRCAGDSDFVPGTHHRAPPSRSRLSLVNGSGGLVHEHTDREALLATGSSLSSTMNGDGDYYTFDGNNMKPNKSDTILFDGTNLKRHSQHSSAILLSCLNNNKSINTNNQLERECNGSSKWNNNIGDNNNLQQSLNELNRNYINNEQGLTRISIQPEDSELSNYNVYYLHNHQKSSISCEIDDGGSSTEESCDNSRKPNSGIAHNTHKPEDNKRIGFTSNVTSNSNNNNHSIDNDDHYRIRGKREKSQAMSNVLDNQTSGKSIHKKHYVVIHRNPSVMDDFNNDTGSCASPP